MPYALVAEHFDPWDLDRLAPVLRERLGLTAYDAKHAARQARGIVADELTRDAADGIAAALAAVSPVRVVEQRFAEKLGRPRRVHRLELNSAALSLRFGYGEREADLLTIPWAHIALLSAGAVHVVQRHAQTAIDPFGEEPELGDPRRTNRQIEEFDEIRADLVADGAADEPDLHVRLVASQLNYGEILGDDAAVAPDDNAARATCDNFRYVLARLGRQATAADVPPPTIALIAAEQLVPKPPPEVSFRDDDEFAAYNRWRLALHRTAPATPDR